MDVDAVLKDKVVLKIALRVGNASCDEMKNRTVAIARGEYGPGRNNPRIWFASTESFAKVLSDKNRTLLHTIN